MIEYIKGTLKIILKKVFFQPVINGMKSKNNIQINSYMRNSVVSINGEENSITITGGNTINSSNFKIRGNGNTLVIENPRDVRNLEIILLGNNSELFIKSGFSIGGGRIVCRGKIEIGENCMFSDNIDIWSSDTHNIKCLHTGDLLNADSPIYIGNNVWLGTHAKVLKGARIPNGCVVGLGSIVSAGEFETNSILVGNPAKCVKKNIKWEN